MLGYSLMLFSWLQGINKYTNISIYLVHFSGFIADRVNLRYFLTAGMMGIYTQQLCCPFHMEIVFLLGCGLFVGLLGVSYFVGIHVLPFFIIVQVFVGIFEVKITYAAFTHFYTTLVYRLASYSSSNG